MDEQIFSGTADYYDRYRPRYPHAMLADLVTGSVGEHGRSMVDWGCGTGEVAIPLSRYFDAVIAVDVDRSMVELGRTKAARQGIDNIDWRTARAEDVELS